MKLRFFTLLIFFVFFLFSNQKNVYSAGGTFDCKVNTSTNGSVSISLCQVDSSNASCDSLYEPDANICNKTYNMDQCGGKKNIPCVLKSQPLECQQGFTKAPLCPSICCKSGQNGAVCDLKNGYPGMDIQDCDFIKKWATSTSTPGCSNTKTLEFENKGGKCVATKPTELTICLGGSTCDTALGGIMTTPDGFITSLLNLALPFAGFISVLAIIYVGYLVLTSQGNPEKLKVAKEVFVSVLTGLLLLIFSFAILNTIGQGFLGINSQTSSTPKKAISPRND